MHMPALNPGGGASLQDKPFQLRKNTSKRLQKII